LCREEVNESSLHVRDRPRCEAVNGSIHQRGIMGCRESSSTEKAGLEGLELKCLYPVKHLSDEHG
jgi:hypothetical protein